MKTILSSIAFTATLYLTSTAYTTDIFMDNRNYDYATHPSHIKNNQNIMDQQFHDYGFTVTHVHTHNELKMLTDTVYDRANKAMNDYCKKHDHERQIQEPHMVRRTEFGITWKQHDQHGRTLGSVKDVYKIYSAVLKSSHNDTVLDTIARFMQCETDKILHMKNDMIFDYWNHYKTWNLYSTGLYRNTWPGDKDKINCVQALTLLNGSATVHVWKSALKIDRLDENYRAQAKELEETTKPDMSFEMSYGDTMLVNPFVRFSVKDKGSHDNIRFLVNEYARYDKRLYETSINKNLFSINKNLFHINENSFSTNKKTTQMLYHNQSFIVNKTHNSADLRKLQNLVQNFCNKASETVKILQMQEQNKDSDQIRFSFSLNFNGQKSISGQWGVKNGVEGYIKDIHKFLDTAIIFQNSDIVMTVSGLLGCRVQDMVHVRSNIVSDQWTKFGNDTILNEWKLYKAHEYNTGQNNNPHSFITTITVLDADVDLHILKTNKLTYFVELDAGHTVFIRSDVEYAFTPKEESSKKVRFYINEFAYPGTCNVEIFNWSSSSIHALK